MEKFGDCVIGANTTIRRNGSPLDKIREVVLRKQTTNPRNESESHSEPVDSDCALDSLTVGREAGAAELATSVLARGTPTNGVCLLWVT